MLYRAMKKIMVKMNVDANNCELGTASDIATFLLQDSSYISEMYYKKEDKLASRIAFIVI